MKAWVPDVLLDGLEAGVSQGGFDAVVAALEFDVLDDVAATLSETGGDPSPAFSAALDRVLGRAIDAVGRYGGVVGLFDSRCLWAYFVESPGVPPAAERCLSALADLQEDLDGTPILKVAGRLHDCSLRCGLDWGRLAWRLVRCSDERTVGLFHGPVLSEALAAAGLARRGETLCAPELLDRLPPIAQLGVRHGRRLILPERLCAATGPPAPSLYRANADHVAPRRWPAETGGVLSGVTLVALRLLWTEDVGRHLVDLYDAGLSHGAELVDVWCRDHWVDVRFHIVGDSEEPASGRRALSLAEMARDRAPSSLALRAGVAAGPAFVGLVDRGDRLGPIIAGEPDRLALSLCHRADEGEILLAGGIVDHVRAAVVLRPRGVMSRPRRRSVATFALESRPRSPSLVDEAPLIDREAPLRALLEGLRAAIDGRFMTVLWVEGPGGVGKSLLIEKFRQYVASRWSAKEYTWIEAPCEGPTGGLFEPLVEAIRAYFLQSDREDEAVNRARFGRVFDQLLQSLPESATRLRRDLLRARPAIATLAGTAARGEGGSEAPTLRRREAELAAKVWLGAVAYQGPLIIHVEDAQWLDEASLAVFRALLQVPRSLPIVVLVSLRPESRATTLVDDVGPEVPRRVIRLAPFSAVEVEALAGQVLGAEVAPDLVRLVHRWSAGLPFAAVQLLVHLRDEGALRATSRGVSLAPTEGELPADARAIVAERLRRLPAASRQAVLAGALLGRRFQRRLLVALLDCEVDPAEAIDHAVALEVLAVDGDCLEFRHHLVWEVAREQIGAAEATRWHRAAAEALVALRGDDLGPHARAIATHYLGAGDGEQALAFRLLAARRARRANVLEAALGHYEAYFRAAKDRYVAAERVEFARDVLLPLGRLEEVLHLLQAAAREAHAAGRLSDVAAALRGQAQVQERQGSDEAALEAYRAALRAWHLADEPAQEGRELTNLAALRLRQGDLPGAARFLDAARELLAEHGDEAGLVDQRAVLARLNVALGDLDKAVGLLEETLETCERLGAARRAAVHHLALGEVLLWRRLRRQAAPHIEKALEAFRELALPDREVEALVLLAEVLLEDGRLDEYRSMHDIAQESLHLVRDPSVAARLFLLDARRARYVGHFDEARGLLDQVEELLKSVRNPTLSIGLRVQRGHLALAEGQSARSQLALARATLQAVGFQRESPLGAAVFRLGQARNAAKRGEQEKLAAGELRSQLSSGIRATMRLRGLLPLPGAAGEPDRAGCGEA